MNNSGFKTFHQWKTDFMATDKDERGVQRIRERYWYYKAYGNYMNKCRSKAPRP